MNSLKPIKKAPVKEVVPEEKTTTFFYMGLNIPIKMKTEAGTHYDIFDKFNKESRNKH